MHISDRTIFSKVSGVYLLSIKDNQKRYVGSSYDINCRIRNHMNCLKTKKHPNKYLQNCFDKYGENSFTFDVLELCDVSLLQERELFYIKSLNPELNISKDTKAPMLGRKHSEETLNKLQGRPAWNIGIPRTADEKLLMSKRRREELLKKDAEWFEKMKYIRKNQKHGRYWLGKKVPDHVAQKLIESGKAIRQKIKCINTGKIYDSQISAAKDLNIKQGHISEHLNNTRSHVKGYTFQRIYNES